MHTLKMPQNSRMDLPNGAIGQFQLKMNLKHDAAVKSIKLGFVIFRVSHE